MAGDISYLKKMRTGQPPHNVVTLGNGSDSFEVAVVLLSNDTIEPFENHRGGSPDS